MNKEIEIQPLINTPSLSLNTSKLGELDVNSFPLEKETGNLTKEDILFIKDLIEVHEKHSLRRLKRINELVDSPSMRQVFVKLEKKMYLAFKRELFSTLKHCNANKADYEKLKAIIFPTYCDTLNLISPPFKDWATAEGFPRKNSVQLTADIYPKNTGQKNITIDWTDLVKEINK